MTAQVIAFPAEKTPEERIQEALEFMRARSGWTSWLPVAFLKVMRSVEPCTVELRSGVTVSTGQGRVPDAEIPGLWDRLMDLHPVAGSHARIADGCVLVCPPSTPKGAA